MDSHKKFILSKLIGDGTDVKTYDYSPLLDFIGVHHGRQQAEVEQSIRLLRESGRIDLGGGHGSVLDSNILNAIRSDVLSLLKTLLEIESFVDFLILLDEQKPLNISYSLDDVIDAVCDSGLIEKPSNWAAVVMLLQECGHDVSPYSFEQALRKNAKAKKMKLPGRNSLYDSMVLHKKSMHYPNWENTTKKQKLYLAIANAAYPLVKSLKL